MNKIESFVRLMSQTISGYWSQLVFAAALIALMAALIWECYYGEYEGDEEDPPVI